MSSRPVVVLVGTLDTKGQEYNFLREIIEGSGGTTVLVDVGVLGEPVIAADFDREQVARLAGRNLSELAEAADRGRALAAMGDGAAAVLASLLEDGRCDAVVIAGGSGASSIALRAFAVVPFGTPKVLVTTQIGSAGGQLAGMHDVTLVSPVVDIAGLNRITRSVLSRVAAAIVAAAAVDIPDVTATGIVFTTMLGLTTTGVTRARETMEDRGYEVITFHATGVGGQAMERLIGETRPSGVLDLTTVELADEVGGGSKPAGPDRLWTAGRLGIPHVVAPGGTDMLRFGPRDTVPSRFHGRRFHEHNDLVTLVRTTPDECFRIGERIVRTLERAGGPCAIVLPTLGVSELSTVNGPFHDPECDAALASALRAGRIRLVEIDDDINGSMFPRRAVSVLEELIGARRTEKV